MKKKWQKVIDAVLDGELTQAQGQVLLDHLGAGPEEKLHLKQMSSVSTKLASLPPLADQPSSLAENVISEIRRRQEFGSRGSVKKTSRLAWAIASAVAGAALAASITVPMIRSSRPKVKPPLVKTPICRIRQLTGEAELERKTALASIQAGDRLLTLDEVRTKKNSQVEIDVDPDTRLILHRESSLKVEGLGYHMGSFRISRGRATAEMLDGTKRSLKLITHENEISIEGQDSVFSLLDLDDGRIAVASIKGQIQLTKLGEKPETLSAGKLHKIFAEKPAQEFPITDELDLEIDKPLGPLMPGSQVLIAGRTDTHARLWINGEQVETKKDGSFSVSLSIKVGDLLEVTAEDVLGSTKTVEIGPARTSKPRIPTEVQPKRVKTKSYRVTW